MMIYTVLKIEEDVDFGCEERAENAPVMAVLTLCAEDGSERILRYPDAELYRKDINVGSRVRLDSGNELKTVE